MYLIFFLRAATADYREGLNPNLTQLYNKHILCGSLKDYALSVLGVDMIATGHYARTSPSQFVGPGVKGKKLGMLACVIDCNRQHDTLGL